MPRSIRRSRRACAATKNESKNRFVDVTEPQMLGIAKAIQVVLQEKQIVDVTLPHMEEIEGTHCEIDGRILSGCSDVAKVKQGAAKKQKQNRGMNRRG